MSGKHRAPRRHRVPIVLAATGAGLALSGAPAVADPVTPSADCGNPPAQIICVPVGSVAPVGSLGTIPVQFDDLLPGANFDLGGLFGSG